MKHAVVLALLFSLLLAGCGTATQATPSPTPSSVTNGVKTGVTDTNATDSRTQNTDTKDVQVISGAYLITSSIPNKTAVKLHVGDVIQVALTPTEPVASWKLSLSDPKILRRIDTKTQRTGTQAVYRVVAVGTTKLIAQSHHHCLDDKQYPCGVSDQLITVTISVTK